jgi:hypothetical protein
VDSSVANAARDDADAQSVLLPGVDPVAIAAVQRKAARLGVPFCEECSKAARATATGA